MKLLAKYAVALACLGGVTVYAQGAKPDAPAAAPAKPAKVLTLGDMNARIPLMEKELRENGQHIRYLQEYARKARDVVKLSCVNDKLVQLRAQLNMFDTAHLQFKNTKDNGAEPARPPFDEMEGVAGAVKNLRDEADACVGAPELYKQEAITTVEHPDFPDDPTTTDPFGTEVEPPAYASPFN